jgi:hypothetical protein
VLLWLERRLPRVMRNGCGFSGGGSSTKACAWDEYINSGLFYVVSRAWVVVGDLGGRCRVCVRGVLGRVVALQTICRVRRGRSSQVGVATFAGRRRLGDAVDMVQVCVRWEVDQGCCWWRGKIQAEANPVWAASALRITIVPKARRGFPPMAARVAV